jgi:hypothetical protein
MGDCFQRLAAAVASGCDDFLWNLDYIMNRPVVGMRGRGLRRAREVPCAIPNAGERAAVETRQAMGGA